MPKNTYGSQVQKRVKRLLEALLCFVDGEFEDDSFKIKHDWKDKDSANPKLTIKTTLITLEWLTQKDKYFGKLTKEQIREALNLLKDFLNILEDNRIQTKGSNDWHFTLKLWSRNKEKNLKQFDEEWERNRPKKFQALEANFQKDEVKVQDLAQSEKNNLLAAYLAWLIQQHSKLEMRGISDIGTYPKVDLDRVYIALRGDFSNPYEIAQSQVLLTNELNQLEELLTIDELSVNEIQVLRWRLLGRSSLMPSLEERDRPHKFQDKQVEKLTLGEAFQRFRRLVILGDPGSGKTTLARWLALNLARSLQARQENLIVPAQFVAPATETETTDINLGKARLPLLVRVTDYALARKENSNLSLLDYLGRHPWLGQLPTYGVEYSAYLGEQLSLDSLNELIKEFIREGQAVIILDGLDEIPVDSNRDEIVRAIESFAKDCVITPKELTKKSTVNSSQFHIVDEPVVKGGNQLIITSRIAGYHADPLKEENMHHVTIEPMDDAAINHFCERWMLVVNRLHDPAGNIADIEAKSASEATALKQQIHDPNRLAVRELAGNPLLLTVLTLVYHNSQSRLPEQRTRLYQVAIQNLIGVWEQREQRKNKEPALKEPEVLYVMKHLAAHIHENYPTGLIHENDVRNLVFQHLAEYRNINLDAPSSQKFENDVNTFLRALREEVGILAARGEYLYGFLHLTFQEYLSGLYLIRDLKHNRRKAIQEILNKANEEMRKHLIISSLKEFTVTPI